MKGQLLLVPMAVMAVTASARDFSYEGLTFTILDEAAHTAMVKAGTGWPNQPGNEAKGDLVIPEKAVEKVGDTEVTYDVVAIGNSAFNGCGFLTSVTIPASVKTIGTSAFYNCFALKSVALPATVTEIGTNAFQGCTTLDAITLPTSLTAVSNYLFDGCSALKQIAIPSNVTSIGCYAFNKSGLESLTIAPNVKSVAYNAFSNCSALKTVNIEKSADPITIGFNVFKDSAVETLTFGRNRNMAEEDFTAQTLCASVKTVTIGDAVTVIPPLMFSDCAALESISFPASVKEIGYSAFAGSGLKAVTIPNTILTVGRDAFSNCESLKDVTIAKNDNADDPLLTLGFNAFANSNVENLVFERNIDTNNQAYVPQPLATTVKSVTLGDDITVIPARFFDGCTELQSVTLPSTLETIGANTFRGCAKLAAIEIPAAVKTIGISTFEDCPLLKNLTLVAADEKLLIERNAFKNAGVEVFNADRNWEYAVYYPQAEDSTEAPVCMESFATTLKDVKLGDKVTQLPANAFRGNASLTDLVLSPELTVIPQNAFNGCAALPGITFPEKVTAIGENAFNGCSAFTELTLPATILTVAPEAFQLCEALATVTLAAPEAAPADDADEAPASIAFGNNVFIGSPVTTLNAYRSWTYDNTYLSLVPAVTTVNFSEDNAVAVPDNAFINCTLLKEVNMTDKVESIGSSAFRWCSALESIAIKAGVTALPESVFSDCAALQSVNTGANVAEIGNEAFFNCTALKDLTFGNKLTSIGDKTFYNCSALEEIILTPGVKSVGELAFGYTGSLKKAAYPDAIENPYMTGINVAYPAVEDETVIIDKWIYRADPTASDVNTIVKTGIYYAPLATEGEHTFDNGVTLVGAKAFEGCDKITKLTMPGVEVLGAEAFSGCSTLAETELSGDLAAVPEKAFFGCVALKGFSVPGSVSSIGNKAFSGCSALADLTMVNGVSKIGDYAFEDCAALTSVVLPGTVTEVGLGTFEDCEALVKSAYPDLLPANPFPAGMAVAYPAPYTVVKNGFVMKMENVGETAIYFAPLSAGDDHMIYEIPSTVTEIGPDAFALCDIHKFIANPEVPAAAVDSSFAGLYDGAVLETSEESALEYAMTAPWNSFSKIVTANDQNVNVFTADGLNYAALLPSSKTAVLLPGDYSELENVVIPATVKYTAEDGTESVCAVEKIAPKTFYNCQNLRSVTIGENVTEIGAQAFFLCRNLEEAQIGSNVATIGEEAFYSCITLKGIELPNTLEIIRRGAFSTCYKIHDVVIPVSVQTIEEMAFARCAALHNFTIADSEEPIYLDPSMLQPIVLDDVHVSTAAALNIYIGRPFDSSAFSGTTALKITLGNLLTEVPAGAFANNPGLIYLEIGSGIETIGDNAFANGQIREVVVPSSVKSVGAGAFANNELTSVTLGCGVETIGDNAFAGNEDIAVVSVTAPAAPALGEGVFSNFNATLMVEPESENVYAAAEGWKEFAAKDLLVLAESVVLNESAIELKSGETFRLVATVNPADATLKTILWESTDPDVAIVDNYGNVTMVSDVAGDMCQIKAYTLYSNTPVAVCNINNTVMSVEDVKAEAGDIDYNAPYEVYTLGGVKVGESIDNVVKGIYIIRQGSNARKIAVK